MPTFMTQPTFAMLTDVWRQLAAESVVGGIGPSYIFVPWAGEQLMATMRGIYYVGIATDAELPSGEPSFEAGLQGTEKTCQQPALGSLGRTPFWHFLNCLSRPILNDTHIQTRQRWGWSNLLKVAGTIGPPGEWPAALIDGQRAACRVAFREEIARLRDSLIVVVSGNEYGILYDSVAEEAKWDKQPRESKIYTLHDPASGNTYIHCYHPKYMQLNGFFDAAVNDVVQLARETLPPFI